MNLKMCEIVQQVKYIADLKKFIKTLERKDIEKWAYCIHDKDKNQDGTLKESHIHVMLKLKDSRDTGYVSMWFGVPENCVNRIKSKRYDDAIPYLIHANAPQKYQYSISEVKSNFDYKAIIEKWKQKQEPKQNTSKNNRELIDGILRKIDTGEIKKYNIYDHLDIVTYSRNKKVIENAFKYYEEKIKGADRNMEIIYMTGDSGSGKTSFAKELARKKGYSFYVSSSSNDILSDYAQQECIILDDFRASSMLFSDLLKATDPYTSSSVKSRYYNKVLHCELLIITTVKPVEDLYESVFLNEDEPIVQFKRRCKTLFQFTKDDIHISEYNPVIKDYSYICTIENPMKSKYPDIEIDPEAEKEKLKRLLGEDVIFTVNEEKVKEEEAKEKSRTLREALNGVDFFKTPTGGFINSIELETIYVDGEYYYKDKNGKCYSTTDLQPVSAKIPMETFS